jgi:hypothetical protein
MTVKVVVNGLMKYVCIFVALVLSIAGGPARAAIPAPPKPPGAPAVVLLPAEVTLTGPKARQRVLVAARGPEGFVGDLTARARFVSSNPKVAVVDLSGVVRPVADGTATLTAVVDGRRATAAVRVRDVAKPFAWSFANHVQPVLTKFGCNSGACHGASAGKGGLKLTLRGYDAPMDHAALTRQALGRRIIPSEPAKSLVLQKATMGIPHGGGRRFKPNSMEHGVIAQWIAAGCPPPSDADPAMERLEVFPPEAVLKQGQEQQILVRAVYADGRTEDVTRWVKYGSSDDTVAAVDDDGLVEVKGHGETAITVWYHSRVAFARISSPFPAKTAPEVFAKAERRNFIDELALKKLQALRVPPAGLCTDEEFIRRAYLDAAGILPTPEEVAAFLAECEQERMGVRKDGSMGDAVRPTALPTHPHTHTPIHLRQNAPTPKARAALIDRLLERPEFTDYWAYRWSDLLLVSSRKLPGKGMWSFYNWIRESVAENKPWDRFVREIVTASGSTLKNGAANFFVLHKDPIDLTETTSQAFLGMSLTCARCHNHPLEKWTLDDYYGMANLFGRVRLRNGDTPGETLVFAAADGEVNRLLTGMPLPPKPLDAPPMALDDSRDRREHLAEWLTSAENPYFARALVNRVWRNFFGRGLVEAEDDLRLTNPPSNEELMAAVTRDFTENGFDVRRLIRTVMNSATYQRSSTPAPGSPPDEKYYSTYIPRRLPAEALLDAISQVTGVPTDFPGYPKGTRAAQLADSQVASYFLSAFGRPPREQTCSCERQEEPSVAQALHLSNGETINAKLRAPGGTVERLLKEELSDEQLLERLYLLAFSRKPRAEQRRRVLAVLAQFPAGQDGRREVIEDLLSAMLTTKEFLFNH